MVGLCKRESTKSNTPVYKYDLLSNKIQNIFKCLYMGSCKINSTPSLFSSNISILQDGVQAWTRGICHP